MANINLGSIKFNWKGSYSGSTAYVVDDVVESSGSSYICIAATTGNAPPNASYWEQMSSAGTNGTDGTDLGTTLTTQGDLVYRNASGLARLGAGTSGQVLQTNGTGANPSWVDAGGGTVLRVFTKSWVGGTTISGTSNTWRQVNNYNTQSITPLSSSSKFIIQWTVSGYANDDHHFFKITRRASNGADTDIGLSGAALGNNTLWGETGSMVYGRHTNASPLKTFQIYDEPNSTSAFTYQLQNQAHSATFYFGRSAHNPTEKQYASQNTCTVWEIDGSKATFTNDATN